MYCLNNPLRYIDPDGRNVVILLWTSNDKRSGHVGTAVDNYTAVDNNGTKTMVHDGTYTYRDMWPKGELNLLNANDLVDAIYSSKQVTMDEMNNIDVTGREGNEVADGLIQLTTDYESDKNIMNYLDYVEDKSPGFQSGKWNCSDYVKAGINASGNGVSVSGTEEIINGVSATTPNTLFRNISKLNNSKTIKNPGDAVNKLFMQRGGGAREHNPKAATRIGPGAYSISRSLRPSR